MQDGQTRFVKMRTAMFVSKEKDILANTGDPDLRLGIRVRVPYRGKLNVNLDGARVESNPRD